MGEYEVLTWALIAIVIVFILLVAFSRYWTGAVETATQTLASVQATHIAGIINTMQTAPENAKHVYELPRAQCEIRITPIVVQIKLPYADVPDKIYSVNLLRSDVAIEEKTIECSEEEERAIRFVKKSGKIEIIQLPRVEND